MYNIYNYNESGLLRRLETVTNKIKAVSNSPIVYDIWIFHWLTRIQRQLIAIYESREYKPRRGQKGSTYGEY